MSLADDIVNAFADVQMVSSDVQQGPAIKQMVSSDDIVDAFADVSDEVRGTRIMARIPSDDWIHPSPPRSPYMLDPMRPGSNSGWSAPYEKNSSESNDSASHSAPKSAGFTAAAFEGTAEGRKEGSVLHSARDVLVLDEVGEAGAEVEETEIVPTASH